MWAYDLNCRVSGLDFVGLKNNKPNNRLRLSRHPHHSYIWNFWKRYWLKFTHQMEARRELLGKIRPPRLEDAGLEDCALPPESIKEAFLKAASAVQSIISHDEGEGEGRCVNDPWLEDSSDVLVGIKDGIDDVHEDCAAKKGDAVWDVAGDEVVTKDAEEKVDEVVLAPDLPGAGKACVDGLQGLEIGEKGDDLKGKGLKDGEYVDNGDDDEEEKEGERPILAEGYV